MQPTTIGLLEVLNSTDSFGGSIIEATLTVSFSQDTGSQDTGIRVQASDITLDGTGVIPNDATWLVVWTVKPGNGVDSVCFNEADGISIQIQPGDGVTILSQSPVGDPPQTQWKAMIRNQVTQRVNVSYFIHGVATVGSDHHEVIFHDPTIAAVPDPMG
jgi:hypothetical protein